MEKLLEGTMFFSFLFLESDLEMEFGSDMKKTVKLIEHFFFYMIFHYIGKITKQ